MPFVDVQFYRCAQNASLESAVHHWIARFEALGHEVARAAVAIEVARRRMTKVTLTATFLNGQFTVAESAHADPYVAVSDAFRKARRILLERTAGLGSALASFEDGV